MAENSTTYLDTAGSGTADPKSRNARYSISNTNASAFLLLGLGAFFAYFGLEYRLGSLRSMGPGMFPVVGGMLLVGIAFVVALTGRKSDEHLRSLPVKPIVAILGSVVAFSLLLETLGLALSAPLLIAGALVASGQGSLKTGVLLGVPLTLAAVLAFPILLGVPLKVFP